MERNCRKQKKREKILLQHIDTRKYGVQTKLIRDLSIKSMLHSILKDQETLNNGHVNQKHMLPLLSTLE
jgi:hypothetical protein